MSGDIVERLRAQKVTSSYGLDRVDILRAPSDIEVEAADALSAALLQVEALTRALEPFEFKHMSWPHGDTVAMSIPIRNLERVRETLAECRAALESKEHGKP